MCKGTRKNQKFNSLVVNKLVEKFGLSDYYIRQCIKLERKSITADTVVKEYKRLVKEVELALNK